MAMTANAHTAHDAELVAGLAAGDLSGRERAAAERLVATCSRCSVLHADLIAITAATAALPAVARTRDFRLTAADAARLHSPWRRWSAGLARPRFAFAQPLGVALATMGLAGLLVGILPSLSVSVGSSRGAPAPAPAAAAGPTSEPGPASGALSATDASISGGTGPEASQGAAVRKTPATPDPASPDPAAVAQPSVAAAIPAEPPVGNGAPGASVDPATMAQMAPADTGASSDPPGAGSDGAPSTDPGTALQAAPEVVAGGTAEAGSPAEAGSRALDASSAVSLLSVLLLLAGVGLFVARRMAVRSIR